MIVTKSASIIGIQIYFNIEITTEFNIKRQDIIPPVRFSGYDVIKIHRPHY